MSMQRSKYVPENIPDVDLARLAAFIDGEGHISICQHRREWPNGRVGYGFKMKVEVANTDPRLMTWLRRFVVGSFYIHKERPCKGRERRVAYRWTVRSREAVDLLLKCIPFFVMKRDQAQLAIEFGRRLGRHSNSTGKNGQYSPLSPEEVNLRDEAVAKMKALRIPPDGEMVIQ